MEHLHIEVVFNLELIVAVSDRLHDLFVSCIVSILCFLVGSFLNLSESLNGVTVLLESCVVSSGVSLALFNLSLVVGNDLVEVSLNLLENFTEFNPQSVE